MSKLDALKAAYTQKTESTTGGGNASWKLFFPFWKMEANQTATFRFLPDRDADNPLQFLVENLQHELTINGEKQKIPCLKMWGEKCPICALASQYYDADDKVMGKVYYHKKSYIGQGVVIESPIEHDQSRLVKLVEFGPQIFKQIQAAFASGDLEEAPHELKGGYNFRFRKTKTGDGQNSYTTSNFAPKQSDLDDAIIAKLELFNLGDYRGQRYSAEAIEAMLLAHRTGSAVKESAAPVSAPAPAQVAAPAPVETGTSAPAPVAAPAEGGGLSVIERLRQKAAAAAAASGE